MNQQKVAIYLRISQEDLHSKESNSITAQRLLVNSYLDSHITLCDLPRVEFVDDGFSGTKFKRPGFQDMIEQVKHGAINTIIVKDLSRFGRDYIEVGDYLEHLFPFLGIRIISINDNYDSAAHLGSTTQMDVVLKNLLYDYYSKDLSQKVKAGMRLKQNKVAYINCISYGYMRHPDMKHQMIIDPVTAPIVQEIFQLFIHGHSTTEIARRLNERNILTPAAYKQSLNKLRPPQSGLSPQWTHHTVYAILTNIKYTGTMVNHKVEGRYIRDSNAPKLPSSEWYLRPNAHAAIIPQTQFDLAQSKIKRKRSYERIPKSAPSHMYYCAYCGRKLRLQNQRIYACESKIAHRTSPCANVHWRKTDIDQIFLSAVKQKIEILRHQNQKSDPSALNYSSQLEHLNDLISDCSKKKSSLYMLYRQKEISAEQYLSGKIEFDKSIANYKAEQKTLERTYQESIKQEKMPCIPSCISNIELLEYSHEIVKRVIVYDKNTLEIYWSIDDDITQINANNINFSE